VFFMIKGMSFEGVDARFTSLGGTLDTHPNPLLKEKGEGFMPAYELQDETKERCGRV
jgi:hypothetical protein